MGKLRGGLGGAVWELESAWLDGLLVLGTGAMSPKKGDLALACPVPCV